MIRINLLPDEYRKRTRMPVKRMAAIAAVVAVNASLLAFLGHLHFAVASEIEGIYDGHKLNMDGLAPQVAYHDALATEIKLFSSREKTLSDITKNRVLWTRKMDQLIDVVNAGNDVDHFVWFDDVNAQIKQARKGRATTDFGSFEANGHSGSDKWDRMANFLDDVVDKDLTAFIDDFDTLNRPQGRKNDSDDDLIPAVNWVFPLKLTLRSPDERLALRNKEEASK
ncbi:MAG: hypothetical protein P1V35_13740 [Planctomycetota bacterium]|nr:hypothetical protein [Planctomycetota bacterium]